MALDRGRDQDISLLGDPGIAIFDHITSLFGSFLFNGSVLVHDGKQKAGINTLLVTVGEGFLLVAIPAGYARDLATKLFDEADRGILCYVDKAFDRGNGLPGIQLKMF